MNTAVQAGSFLLIEQLSKTFIGEDGGLTPVIDKVSLSIGKGELIVFLGPSGCGKTTLMRIVGGLEAQSHGQVLLENTAIKGPDRKKGMVFQSYSSFPWLTVQENIEFGLRYRRDINNSEKPEIAQHYMELVGLSEFADFYTNRISGGMRQRVAIARTLAANPDVLLMDEPFGALDAQTREFLQFQLLELNREERKTTIFVTHDVEEAVLLADRIIIFSVRPATIIEEIRVQDYLIDAERTAATKESEAFFKLRNRILNLTREQARRTEELFYKTNR